MCCDKRITTPSVTPVVSFIRLYLPSVQDEQSGWSAYVADLAGFVSCKQHNQPPWGSSFQWFVRTASLHQHCQSIRNTLEVQHFKNITGMATLTIEGFEKSDIIADQEVKLLIKNTCDMCAFSLLTKIISRLHSRDQAPGGIIDALRQQENLYISNIRFKNLKYE